MKNRNDGTNSSLRILVADDNEINLIVIKGMLENRGHQVVVATDGKAAIESMLHDSFDLAILDCLMPRMDGFETARFIRSATNAKIDANIPILAITALTSQEDRKKCFDAGMTGYITKPVRIDDLFAWIETNCATKMRSTDQSNDTEERSNSGINAAELMEKMSPLLVRDATQWLHQLSNLHETNQLEALGSLAHKIRGSCEVLGIKGLSDTASTLENSINRSETGNLSEAVGQLSVALQNLLDDISKPD